MEPQNKENILGPKKLNYDFLLLVRDKKYPQALALGRKILEAEPNNPSVKKFCDFISSQSKGLQQMVQKQKEEQEYESVDSDQEEEESQEEAEGKSDDNEKSQSQKQSQEEQEEQEESKPNKPKIQLRTCTLNPIPHICTRDHN